jgi:hypothetical protein
MKMEKVIYARFPNDGTYYNKIKVSFGDLKDCKVYTDEVFCTVKGIRIAIKKNDWEDLKHGQRKN